MRLSLAIIQCLILWLAGRGSDDIPPEYRGRIVSARPHEFRQKLLALTIDDGPDPNITPKILDTLKSHGAHATFFVLGASAARHPALLRRMVAEGHVVASHSYTHPIHPPKEQAERELARTESAIRRATGRTPDFFRPPGGNRSSWNTKAALARGYTVVLWTISTADTATHDPNVIANNVIHTPAPGDIVLMHDSATKAATAQALPRILDELGRHGWRFVTIPELLTAWHRAGVRKL